MTTRPFDKILSVSDLETTADRLESYFFTRGAMKFFSSRIDWKLFPVDGERGYFVTGEKAPSSRAHKWTVRKYAVSREPREDGRECDSLDIDNASAFQAYTSVQGARERAAELQGYALIDPKAF